MIHRIYTLLTLLSIAAGITAQKNAVRAFYRDSIITIDGSRADWQQPFSYYDSKTKLQYSIADDSSYLYLCFATTDEPTQMKMIHGGVSVWLDTRGGKKRNCGIHYPLKGNETMDMPMSPEVAGEQNNISKRDRQKMQLLAKASQKELRIQGLINIPDATLPLDNLLDIRAAFDWDLNNVLTYELKVPFSLFLKPSLSASDTLRPISIGINIDGLTLPVPPESALEGSGMGGPPGGGGMGGAPGGGMGGGPQDGGGMGGPSGGGMGGGMSMGGPPPGMGGEGGSPGMAKKMELTKSQESWIKLFLQYR